MISIQPNFYPYSSIAKGVYILDQHLRKDIYDCCILDERDYVSTLMSYIRLFLRNSQLVKGLFSFQSQILNSNLEKTIGCDALILFRAKNAVKVCMFEAKYPRLYKENNYSWDYVTSSNKAHFHDQLIRQNKWSSEVGIWELFINDHVPGFPLKGFDKYGSTCIWHQDAYQYTKEKAESIYHHKPKYLVWNNKKLQECIEQLPYNPLNIEDVLISILIGKMGKAIPVIGNSLVTIKSSEEESINIPVGSKINRDDFMSLWETTGINNFLVVELESISFTLDRDF
ncbi:hypothetical protein [Nostoc sp. FACHB-888]|uniref:hypothetical protein n=1 Tax=Nostoc sp. FACHB-888 TaxID=2692842 RepID=UPI001684E117|nr:hypothetical protein [Nostoc sp. FACHB-888]MBD2247500.1 hypothetical protein [Nostoc sp. FACHB-888]